VSVQSPQKLRQIIERLESLEQERAGVSELIREALAEARSDGFNVKIVRQVLKIRKMKPQEVDEQDHLLQIYLDALSKEAAA